jgi:hypothetical protein
LLFLTSKTLAVTVQEDEAQAWKASIQTSLNTALSSSERLHSPFINAMLSICYRVEDFSCPTDLIARLSQKSSNFYLGILLIEKQLRSESNPVEVKESQRKRSKRGIS